MILLLIELLFLLSFAVRENDLVYEEEDYHADTAVKNCSSDVVNKWCHELACYCNPDTVDGINDAGDDDKCEYIPCDLLSWLIVVAENKQLLNREEIGRAHV